MRYALRCTAGTLIAAALAIPGLAAPPAKTAAAAPAAQAAPPAPCTAPELHQLDFWVGEWDLTWPGQGNGPAGTGTNRIEKVMDGCVIQESFAANGPQGLVGHSVSTYDPREKIWKQTWVDNQGSYLTLTGGLEDGKMTLRQKTTGPDGKPRLFRMVFLNVKPDSFDWNWESSKDDGKTWMLGWPIHYQRKGTVAP
jgi:hypothetical protein